MERQDWVELGDLVAAEHLWTEDGPVEILATQSLTSGESVYNLEVNRHHVYRVSGLGILVHNTGGITNYKKSLRLEYVGRTPGKSSRTGREVQERMRKEDKLRGTGGNEEFLASDGIWYSLSDAEMAHIEDAVKFWNRCGKYFGRKAKEVRAWMLDSNNYTLDLAGLNRSAGGKLKDRYEPPISQGT